MSCKALLMVSVCISLWECVNMSIIVIKSASKKFAIGIDL
jgi:hypothetical protein